MGSQALIKRMTQHSNQYPFGFLLAFLRQPECLHFPGSDRVLP